MRAFRERFLEAEIVRCLQHVKQNVVSKPRFWASRNRGVLVRQWVEQTAFFPAHLFSYFWEHAFELLSFWGEDRFLRYLKGEHFFRQGEVVRADWQSHQERLEAPFSSYSNNVLESMWRALDVAMDDVAPRVDILSEIRYWEQVCHLWHEQGKFVDLQPELRTGSRPARPPMPLLRGEGVLSQRGALAPGKQVRRFTAKGLIDLSAEQPVALLVQIGGQDYWACPKYDLDDFDEPTLRAFARVMVGPLQGADLEALGVNVPEGVDLQRLVHVAARYTLLHVREGRILETHADFAKAGVTEHVLWLQRHRSFANHQGLAGRPKQRRLHANRARQPPRAGRGGARSIDRPSVLPHEQAPGRRGAVGPVLPVRGAVAVSNDGGGEAELDDVWSELFGDDDGDVLEAEAEAVPEVDVQIVNPAGDVLVSFKVLVGTGGEEVLSIACDRLGTPYDDTGLLDLTRGYLVRRGVVVNEPRTLLVTRLPRGG